MGEGRTFGRLDSHTSTSWGHWFEPSTTHQENPAKRGASSGHSNSGDEALASHPRGPHCARRDGDAAAWWRYSPPGVPVVNFASEAGLAVLVALRYLPGDPAGAPDDYVLGWTEVDATPERVPDEQGEQASRVFVTRWLEERRSLLAAVRSKVLPEAETDMNPAHPDARDVTARHAAFQLRRVPAHAADEGPLQIRGLRTSRGQTRSNSRRGRAAPIEATRGWHRRDRFRSCLGGRVGFAGRSCELALVGFGALTGRFCNRSRGRNARRRLERHSRPRLRGEVRRRGLQRRRRRQPAGGDRRGFRAGLRP